MSLCTRCGLFDRMPALLACGSCFEVLSSSFWDGLKDPDAPLPCCSVCEREETPDPDAAIKRGDAPVCLALVSGEQCWTCMDCLDGDGPESWKRQ